MNKRLTKKKENAARIKELETMLARCEKAIKTRDMVIQELKMDVAHNYDIQRILSAYVAIMTEEKGGSVRINRDKISSMIGKYSTAIDIDKDTNEYVIEIEKNSEMVGEEQTE